MLYITLSIATTTTFIKLALTVFATSRVVVKGNVGWLVGWYGLAASLPVDSCTQGQKLPCRANENVSGEAGLSWRQAVKGKNWATLANKKPTKPQKQIINTNF